VVQTESGKLRVCFQTAQPHRSADIERRIRARLQGALDQALVVEVVRFDDLEPSPGEKFRVVERRTGASA
jgi:hypothetical protein